MGYYPPACKSSGIGPYCDHPERGDGYKAQCLSDAKAKIIGTFYDCMAACAPEIMAQDISGGGTRAGASVETVDGCNDLLHTIGDTSLFVNASCKAKCFRTVESAQDLKRCYCSEVTCISCLGEPEEPGGPVVEPTPSDPTTDDPTSPSVTVNPPGFPTLRVVASSYNIPIPVVYARAVITGNIIWIGNKRSGEIEQQYLETSTLVKNTIRYGVVDFAIGLCKTRVAGLTRIYFDNKLVYNNTYTSSGGKAVLDLAAMGGDDADQSIPTSLIATFELFSGGENQRANRLMTQEHPVAYRGLTYLYVANYGVIANGASLPDIKVEVTQVSEDAFFPTVSSTLAAPDFEFSAVSDAYIHVDHGQDKMTVIGVGRGGVSLAGTEAVSYNTLAHRVGYNPLTQLTVDTPIDLDPRALHVTKTGAIIYQAGGAFVRRKTYAVLPHDPSSQLVFGVDSNLVTPPGATGLWNIANARGALAADATVVLANGDTTSVVAFGQGQYLSFVKLDMDNSALTFLNTVDLGANTEIVSVLYYEWNVRASDGLTAGFAVVYRVPGAANIKVTYFPSYTPTGGAVFTGSLLSSTTITLPSGLWGGVGNTVNNVYLEYTNPGLHIIMQTGGTFRHFRTEALTNGIAFPATTLSVAPPRDHKLRPYPVGTITWMEGNTLHEISRENGFYSATALPVTLPVKTGAQYYDAKLNMLTYIASGVLVQLYLSRILPKSVSLRDVLSDILESSDISSERYHLVGLDDISVKGYLISDAPTTRGVIELLEQFYGLSVLESGGRIVITARKLAATEIVIPASSLLLDGDSTKTIQDVGYSDRDLVTSALVTYLDEDALLSARYQTATKDVLEDDAAFVDRYKKVSLAGPIVMNKDEARRLAERTLLRLVQRSYKRSFTLGPKHWYVDPDDFVKINEAA